MLKINILTLFPEFFSSPLQTSMLKIAQTQQKIEFKLINIRDFAQDKHQITDEPPYGGGAGMIMKIEPIALALQSLKLEKNQLDKLILLTSAKGQLFTQALATEYSQLTELTLICGHYQDVDQRVADYLVDGEISIGNYILTGGEPATLVIADVVTRLIPGVLGNQASLANESHSQTQIKSAPQYTRPENYQGWTVPSVLLSGDHQKIEQWRKKKLKLN